MILNYGWYDVEKC